MCTIVAYVLLFKKIYLIKHYLGKDTEEEHLAGLYDILFFTSKLRLGPDLVYK